MTTDLHTLLDDHQMFHSELQMDCFITAKAGGTPYGMYVQALRELHKRWRGLKGLYAERELIFIDIAEFESGTLDDIDEFFENARNTVRLAQKRSQLDEVEANIADTEREFSHFYGQAEALKEQIGELTAEKRERLEREFWVFKAKEQAARDFLTAGRVTEKTLELVQYLHPVERDLVKSSFVDPKEHVAWYDSLEYPIPDGRQLDAHEIHALVEQTSSE